MLLRPLPVPDPAALVNLAGARARSRARSSCNQAGDCQSVFSYPMFRDLERVQTVFTGIAGPLPHGRQPGRPRPDAERRRRAGVGQLLPDARACSRPLGRLLTPDDDRTPGAHPVVVLSHAYWSSHFAESPVGASASQLVVNGIVDDRRRRGAARLRRAPRSAARPHVFVPLSMREALLPGWKGLDNRRSYWAYVFARLKPGVSMEQAARGAWTSPYRAIITDVEAPLQTGHERPDDGSASGPSRCSLEPGARGQSEVRVEARAPLLLLLGVTALVLLTACANIANLLLARAAGRAGEMAVRLSIGASRGQVLTQLLVESCTLALARRRRRPARGALDAEPASRRCCRRRRRARSPTGIDATRAALRAGPVAGHRPRLRPVSGAAQHAARPARRCSRATPASRRAPAPRRASAPAWPPARLRCRWRCWSRPGSSPRASTTSAASTSACRPIAARHLRRVAGR